MLNTGVTVVMATHRRPKLLKECLASIELALTGRVRWVLVIADDDSDLETQDVLFKHHYVTSADYFRHFSYPKARSVGEAKNRAMQIAVAEKFFNDYPWIMWMDDDDLFRSERVTELLPAAIDRGHRLVAGHWRTIGLPPQNRVAAIDIFGCIRPPVFILPLQTTIIHASLVKNPTQFFDRDVPLWEDVVLLNRLRFEGTSIVPIATSGPVVDIRHMGGLSASTPVSDRDEVDRMIDEVMSKIKKLYGPFDSGPTIRQVLDDLDRDYKRGFIPWDR